jgi:DNA-binding NarL/FixJ family response regulator
MALAERAAKQGWTVAVGRAYPVERGVPYALFADAFVPLLRGLEPGALAVLTRGGHEDIARLFPALRDDAAPPAGDGAPEAKARLLWTFAQLLARYAARRPLLVVLENLQWADASSLELLHFLARQAGEHRLLLVATYNDEGVDPGSPLATAVRSLRALGAVRELALTPLSAEATAELVQRAFGADPGATREFSARLHAWTRGNPYFIEETLKALAVAGRLETRDGVWAAWDPAAGELPRSIRDAVAARMGRLSERARVIANLCAVVGARASFDALAAVGGGDEALLAALDELRAQRVLVEARADGGVVYDFAHPILQETLYAELGLARARRLHAQVAEALERHYGGDAESRAGELAFHFVRADAQSLTPKAVRYLAAAGRDALVRHADREAADYLGAARDLARRAGDGGPPLTELTRDLARARQRLGDYDGALALWQELRDAAERAGEWREVAAVARRMGLACYWSGRSEEALAHHDAALRAADQAGDLAAAAYVRLAKGVCLQDLGRKEETEREALAALAIGEQLADPALLARAHRALLLVYAWTGAAARAREHGARAIALAEDAGDPVTAWSGHWGSALLAGLTGNAADARHHLAAAERLAETLRSPVLGVWTAEVAVEYASGVGDWDAGLARAERAIATARALGLRALLPRLLVWSALMRMGRGQLEAAKALVDEAWRLSGAGRGAGEPRDVHAVVPAHLGLAAYHLATQDYRHAIKVGEAGLAIADRTGYVVWAIHRLLPVVGEAALWLRDFERAARHSARMRRDAARVGHPLGLAWADACDGLVLMLTGRQAEAVPLLRGAADALDAIPMLEYGARVRRQLARALMESGAREEAARELKRAHDIFARLGAEQELDATREWLRDLGVRPPARAAVGPGAGGLTGREVEIARLVAERKSNKEIGTALKISARTVSTHLSNIFGKLGVGSRGELADRVRERGLPE